MLMPTARSRSPLGPLPCRTIAFLFALGVVVVSPAADRPGWPQFRGPSGQGHLGSQRLPTEWSEKEGVVWKTEISGLGHASPVHDGATAWLATASRDGRKLGVVAVDLESGSIVHSTTIFEPVDVQEIHHDNSYASPTPVLVDDRLFLHYGRYGTAAVDTETANILWRRDDLPVAHEGGPGSSPVYHNGQVIITCDGADRQFVAALDAETGSTTWLRERSAPQRPNPTTHRAFATPLLVERDGRTVLISPGADHCQAYDAATGEELWRIRYVGFSNVPRPVEADGVAFVCTGFFKPQLWAISLEGSGDVTDSHVLWKYRGAVSETPSPLIHDGQVILLSDKGILTGINLSTGKRAWILRVGGNYSASPLYAGGKLYCCSEEGLVKVIDLSSSPRVAATNECDEGIMASPAVIDGDLLIRTTKSLYRINGVNAADPSGSRQQKGE